jgi:hypothetical protein
MDWDWVEGGDEGSLVLVRAAVRQDLAAAEEFEHGVFANSASLPGGDDRLEVLAGHAGDAEIEAWVSSICR